MSRAPAECLDVPCNVASIQQPRPIHTTFTFRARDGTDASSREEGIPDSDVAYIARSKRDVAEHFGVAWSTMQPRLVGKIGAKV